MAKKRKKNEATSTELSPDVASVFTYTDGDVTTAVTQEHIDAYLDTYSGAKDSEASLKALDTAPLSAFVIHTRDLWKVANDPESKDATPHAFYQSMLVDVPDNTRANAKALGAHKRFQGLKNLIQKPKRDKARADNASAILAQTESAEGITLGADAKPADIKAARLAIARKNIKDELAKPQRNQGDDTKFIFCQTMWAMSGWALTKGSAFWDTSNAHFQSIEDFKIDDEVVVAS